MRQWCVVVVVWAFALAGCQTDGTGSAEVAAKPPPAPSAADIEKTPGYKRPTDAQALASARQTVSGKLKDPDSAKFTDVARKTTPNVRGEPTDVVCGKVNAKNGYGGYTGAKAFVYFVGNKSSTTVEELVGPDVVNNFCPEMLR
jgi:hypothetical protein